jgi:SAM-dependent methyltransferase
MSVSYYDRNAAEYFRDTVNADLSQLRARFLAHVPEGGDLLDAGCGSGRDALAFATAGYRVVAFDASGEMAQLARAHTGLPIHQMTFDEVAWTDQFDGVWASASLLHVPAARLPHTIARLARALRSGGVMYLSFKLGDRERTNDGRTFTDMTESALRPLLVSAGMRLIDLWTTPDVRGDRSDVLWLNALASPRP